MAGIGPRKAKDGQQAISGIHLAKQERKIFCPTKAQDSNDFTKKDQKMKFICIILGKYALGGLTKYSVFDIIILKKKRYDWHYTVTLRDILYRLE